MGNDFFQNSQLDLSKYRQEASEAVNLDARTFHSRQFLDGNDVTPCGLGFFQSDYEESLHKVYHDVLNMKEPKYEYNFSESYVEPWDDMYDNQG